MSRPNLNVLQFIHCFVFLVLTQLWRHAIMMSHTYDVTQSWRHATMTSHHYDVAQLWRHTIMTSCFGFITQKPSLTCNMSSDKINWKVFLEKITKTFEWKISCQSAINFILAFLPLQRQRQWQQWQQHWQQQQQQ